MNGNYNGSGHKWQETVLNETVELLLSCRGRSDYFSAVVRDWQRLLSPFPTLSLERSLEESVFWGMWFFFDSGGLDTSLSCFGHLEQHSAGGRGWRVSSASQDSALRTRWWDAPTYVTVLSCTGPSLSYLSPPPLPVCVLNSSFKIMVKHCLPFLEPSSVTLPSTQNWLDASSLVVSMIPFNYF